MVLRGLTLGLGPCYADCTPVKASKVDVLHLSDLLVELGQKFMQL